MTPEDDPLPDAPAPAPTSSTRPRWRGGRPRSSGEERRGAALPRVRVTAEELAEVRGQAKELGVPIGELVRRAVLGRRVGGVPAINREAWSRLGPLVANLNQLVKLTHQGQAVGAPVDLLEQIRAEVLALREALLGREGEP